MFIETLEVHLPPIIMQITPLKPYRFITCLVRPMVVQIKSFFDKIFQFRFSRKLEKASAEVSDLRAKFPTRTHTHVCKQVRQL